MTIVTLNVATIKKAGTVQQTVAKSYTVVRRQRERETGSGIGFWNLKAHLQCHNYSNKVTFPNLSQTVLLARKHCSNTWTLDSHSHPNHHIMNGAFKELWFSIYLSVFSTVMVLLSSMYKCGLLLGWQDLPHLWSASSLGLHKRVAVFSFFSYGPLGFVIILGTLGRFYILFSSFCFSSLLFSFSLTNLKLTSFY